MTRDEEVKLEQMTQGEELNNECITALLVAAAYAINCDGVRNKDGAIKGIESLGGRVVFDGDMIVRVDCFGHANRVPFHKIMFKKAG
jgi:hypothetical protein